MKTLLRVSVIILICSLAVAYGDNKAVEQRAIDVQQSHLTVHAYKSGLFSGFAHDHEIEAPVASGSVDVANRKVQLEFEVAKMKVLDPKESADKKTEIEKTMLSDKVLDAAKYPKISFVSRTVNQVAGGYDVEGDLTLHGVTRALKFPVQMKDGTFTGKVAVKQTEFGITPVSIAGGAVKVKDVVDITFEVKMK